MKIEDARAVVTGGASGLGAAVASHVASKGGKVVIVDVQEGPGQATAAKLGANVSFLRCDVTSEAEVNSTMEAAASRMGGLNLLVNCAGVVGAGRVLGKNGPMAGDFFSKVVHINLIGTFLCDKAAANIMQNNTPTADGERGLLVHTASVAAYEGQIGGPKGRFAYFETSGHPGTIIEISDISGSKGRFFERVKAEGIAYGSGPRSRADMQINHRHGGRGFYFEDPNGHVLEVLTA